MMTSRNQNKPPVNVSSIPYTYYFVIVFSALLFYCCKLNSESNSAEADVVCILPESC